MFCRALDSGILSEQSSIVIFQVTGRGGLVDESRYGATLIKVGSSSVNSTDGVVLTGGYVDVTGSQFAVGFGDFTYELIGVNDTGGISGFGSSSTIGGLNGYQISADVAWVGYNGLNRPLITTGANIKTHWALVRSGSNLKLFKNGVLQSQRNDANLNLLSQVFRIGARYSNGIGQLMQGKVKIRITSRAVYSANFTPPSDF